MSPQRRTFNIQERKDGFCGGAHTMVRLCLTANSLCSLASFFVSSTMLSRPWNQGLLMQSIDTRRCLAKGSFNLNQAIPLSLVQGL
jgi:hypothetical protein